jgi:hypothetical protein
MRTKVLTTLSQRKDHPMRAPHVRPALVAVAAAASALACVGLSAPAQASTVRPAIATNCTYTVVQGSGPGAWGYATCTNGPTDHWQLVIDCVDYRDRTHVTYGHVSEGSGTSAASCGGATDYFSWDRINNID